MSATMILDTISLSTASRVTLGKAVIDYQKMVSCVEECLGLEIKDKNAVFLDTSNSGSFKKYLETIGFKVYALEPNMSVELLAACLAANSKSNTVILGVNSKAYQPLIELLRSRGVTVVVLSGECSKSLTPNINMKITTEMTR